VRATLRASLLVIVVDVNNSELPSSSGSDGDTTRPWLSWDLRPIAGCVEQLPEALRPDDRGCRLVAPGRPSANYARLRDANFKKFWGYPPLSTTYLAHRTYVREIFGARDASW
jgi:hypothetical protein